MSRGKKTKTKKHDLLREICQQIEIPSKNGYFAKGSTIQATALEDILLKLGAKTGIPPQHLSNYEKDIWRLLHKSITGMVLAIEIINKPSIQYRMECFLFLLINAWELLLKARIIKNTKDSSSIKGTDNPDRTITFGKAVRDVFKSQKDPVRRNLLIIEDLRNNAAHLFMPFVPPNALQLFQASILNYEKFINTWFRWSLCDYIPRGMIFLVAEIDPSQFSLRSPLLKKHLSPDALAYLSEWQDSVRDVIKGLKEDQVSSFAMTINLNLAMVSNPSKADVLAHWEGSENADPAVLAVRYQRMIDKYPLSFKDLWTEIKNKISTVKQGDVHKIIRESNMKENPEYSSYNFRNKKHADEYQKSKGVASGTPSIYNYKALEFIIEKLGILQY